MLRDLENAQTEHGMRRGHAGECAKDLGNKVTRGYHPRIPEPTTGASRKAVPTTSATRLRVIRFSFELWQRATYEQQPGVQQRAGFVARIKALMNLPST